MASPPLTPQPRGLYISASGFSLPELLAVIAIVALLGAISTVVVSRVIQAGQRTDSLNQLRGLGLAVNLFTADNKGYLPGPLTHTQWAYMNRNDSSQFSWVLRPYLGCADAKTGQIIPALGHKRFFANCQTDLETAYIINHKTKVAGSTQSAWGYASSSSGSLPQKAVLIDVPQTAVALMEVDQELLTDTGKKASGFAPEKPLFRDGRGALFFDAHVEVASFSYQLGKVYKNTD